MLTIKGMDFAFEERTEEHMEADSTKKVPQGADPAHRDTPRTKEERSKLADLGEAADQKDIKPGGLPGQPPTPNTQGPPNKPGQYEEPASGTRKRV